MANYGGFHELLKIAKGFRQGVYIYKGHLVNQSLAKRFGMKHKALELLLNLYWLFVQYPHDVEQFHQLFVFGFAH